MCRLAYDSCDVCDKDGDVDGVAEQLRGFATLIQCSGLEQDIVEDDVLYFESVSSQVNFDPLL